MDVEEESAKGRQRGGGTPETVLGASRPREREMERLRSPTGGGGGREPDTDTARPAPGDDSNEAGGGDVLGPEPDIDSPDHSAWMARRAATQAKRGANKCHGSTPSGSGFILRIPNTGCTTALDLLFWETEWQKREN